MLLLLLLLMMIMMMKSSFKPKFNLEMITSCGQWRRYTRARQVK